MRRSMTPKTRVRRVQDSYFALVKRFPLRRIRDDADHRAAMRIATELMKRGDGNLDQGEIDYLGTLAQLIERYERDRWPFPRSTPLQTLKHLMEARGMSTADLARLLGSSSAASMVLRGQREMSKTHIRKLADHFRVSTDLFL